MTTVLCTNAYKAANEANKNRVKVKSLPISETLLLRHHEGRVLLTPFRFDELAEHTQAIPARIDGDEFQTCVPAKPFTDWLHVTQVKQPKKIRPTFRNRYQTEEWVDDRIELTFDATLQNLYIKAGNARATFKCLDAANFPPC